MWKATKDFPPFQGGQTRFYIITEFQDFSLRGIDFEVLRKKAGNLAGQFSQNHFQLTIKLQASVR